MPGGGPGSNMVGSWGAKPILRLRPGATPLANPKTQYGTIGINDSGLVLYEAKGWKSWGFQLAPETLAAFPIPNNTVLPNGYVVTLYYTILQVAALAQFNRTQPMQTPIGADGSTILPVGAWWDLPQASDNAGSATDNNPITFAGPVCAGTRFAVAFRAVLTNVIGTPAAGAIVYGGGAP
jgi:hypothetical protein